MPGPKHNNTAVLAKNQISTLSLLTRVYDLGVGPLLSQYERHTQTALTRIGVNLFLSLIYAITLISAFMMGA